LLYVDNVIAAIRFLASTGQDIGHCYILSDDEVPENNYADVVRLMAGFLGVSPPSKTYFECPPSVLSMMLWMGGRSDTNPRRVYRCDKLLKTGFRKPVPFEEGIRRFAEWFKSGKRRTVAV
jgi:nucleoside-diphosphate-sugar epimerase